MRFLAQQAVKNDCREIRARFVPSARNQVAADYLERAGFTKTGEHWTLRLPSELNKIPKDYVKVE
jgi:predicted enzyme involved in methoxymalonyl-ACP biosynthesis